MNPKDKNQRVVYSKVTNIEKHEIGSSITGNNNRAINQGSNLSPPKRNKEDELSREEGRKQK